ncbi:hypothetical protein [Ruminococcus sp.]|uniref:hypothetical protein n=1 Tax=Ruminococcus sp. TaxID=41978 RepID=UPI001B6E4879|nr:hypothetical protein [Ruminococcus sp.]MBP5432358.1 hypothetical protein [Ruminococcus sp.]
MERNDKAKEKITVKDENDVSSENESRNSFGRSSLIMGILAVLGCICFYVVGIPFALIGIIFSIIYTGRQWQKKGRSRTSAQHRHDGFRLYDMGYENR